MTKEERIDIAYLQSLAGDEEVDAWLPRIELARDNGIEDEIIVASLFELVQENIIEDDIGIIEAAEIADDDYESGQELYWADNYGDNIFAFYTNKEGWVLHQEYAEIEEA